MLETRLILGYNRTRAPDGPFLPGALFRPHFLPIQGAKHGAAALDVHFSPSG